MYLVLRVHQHFSRDLIQKAAPQKQGMTGSNPLLSAPVRVWVGAVGPYRDLRVNLVKQ